MNYIVKITEGKPIIYGMAGKDGKDAPVYVFEDEESFNAAFEAGMIPVGAVVIKTYDGEVTAGGVNAELLDRISQLESSDLRLTEQISSVSQSRAGTDVYGMVKLSDSSTVTESTGLAMPAREKNAALPGTLANKIETRTSIEAEITFSNIDQSCVVSNISYGFIKNGVGYLQIDAIIKNEPAKDTLTLFKLSNCRPSHYAANDGISSKGKMYTVGIFTNGDVYIHPKENVGNFDIRHQITFKVA